MNRIHLHPAIAISLFGTSVLASGLLLLWAWRETLHLFFDFSQNHPQGFAAPLGTAAIGIRVFVTVVFALILRYWARVESLGGWILCSVGVATLALAVLLSIRVMAGHTIEVMLYADALEVPYGRLLGLFATNLIAGAIHGGLGWLFLQRLMSNRSGAS